MIRGLLQRWFLLCPLGGALLLWLWPAGLLWTRQVDPRWVVAAILFLSGWSLESRSLLKAVLRPWPALWALVISYGLIPALACAAGLLAPSADIRIGLLISGSVPCTLAAALIWTRLARGNEATALLVILLSTGTSWLATTAWLSLVTATATSLDSLGMMRELALVLVLPLSLGQLLRAPPTLARLATRLKVPIGVVSRLMVLVIIFRAALDVVERLQDRGADLGVMALIFTACLCLGIHLVALTAGLFSGKLLGFDHASRVAVAIAGSQKTLPVGLLVFDLYFKGYPLAVVPLVFYHVGQLVADTFFAELMSRKESARSPWKSEAQGEGVP